MTAASALAWRTLAKPLRVARSPRGLDAAWAWTIGQIPRLAPRRARLWRRAGEIVTLRQAIASEDESWLRREALRLRELVRRGRASEQDLDQALATACEAARRVLGLTPHREQIMGALALGSGCIAEMATGEGKTLVAALAATLAGWRGRGVHVITVNDYLAQRDATWMRPVYELCGLSVGYVVGESSEGHRREAYGAEITYGTNKEIAADFLRDRLKRGTNGVGGSLGRDLIEGIAGERASPRHEPLQRGLACAIVDEADSVLIDEAVTPLIIAGPGAQAESADVYKRIAVLARELQAGEHYTADAGRREVQLTRAGRRVALERLKSEPIAWGGDRRKHELVIQALTAHVHYTLGSHYVIQDGRIVIVDEFTGRLMPDRTWRDGMHQAIEAKEGLTIRPDTGALASISFQRFFRLYERLSGMTGTAREAAGELWRAYRLPVVRVPTHRPIARRELPDRVFATADAKWNAIAEQATEIHQQGRPILIGTRSVVASERIGAELTERALDPAILSATRHVEEAGIVARAGRATSVTVATNMAGRGTDIRLDEGVEAAGGLAVLASERHESRRVDRQLFGRCGRQGDPGSAQAFVSLEDELVTRYAPWAASLLRGFASGELKGAGIALLARLVFRLAERRASHAARRMRAAVVRSDDWLDDSLGFAGRSL